MACWASYCIHVASAAVLASLVPIVQLENSAQIKIFDVKCHKFRSIGGYYRVEEQLNCFHVRCVGCNQSWVVYLIPSYCSPHAVCCDVVCGLHFDLRVIVRYFPVRRNFRLVHIFDCFGVVKSFKLLVVCLIQCLFSSLFIAILKFSTLSSLHLALIALSAFICWLNRFTSFAILTMWRVCLTFAGGLDIATPSANVIGLLVRPLLVDWCAIATTLLLLEVVLVAPAFASVFLVADLRSVLVLCLRSRRAL